MSIVLVASTSGSVTLQEPAVSGSTVLTLPAVSGTILTTTSPKAGNVIQVVQGTNSTETSTTSSSYVTTNLTASITPTSSSSKILILVEMCVTHRNKAGDTGGDFTIYRGVSTNLLTRGGDTQYDNGGLNNANYVGMNYLDSPATTSSTTYTVYMKSSQSGTQMVAHHNNSTGTIILMEIAA
jgi:hypothetical protein